MFFLIPSLTVWTSSDNTKMEEMEPFLTPTTKQNRTQAMRTIARVFPEAIQVPTREQKQTGFIFRSSMGP